MTKDIPIATFNASSLYSLRCLEVICHLCFLITSLKMYFTFETFKGEMKEVVFFIPEIKQDEGINKISIDYFRHKHTKDLKRVKIEIFYNRLKGIIIKH